MISKVFHIALVSLRGVIHSLTSLVDNEGNVKPNNCNILKRAKNASIEGLVIRGILKI